MSDAAWLYIATSILLGLIAASTGGLHQRDGDAPWWLRLAVLVFLSVLFAFFWPLLFAAWALDRWGSGDCT